MELFDLHCDTILKLKMAEEGFRSQHTQFSLTEADRFQRLTQTMAVFVPDTIRGEDAKHYFDVHYEYLKKILKLDAEAAELAYGTADIVRITDRKKCAVLLSVESGAVLAGREENVAYLAECGVKLMTLTWNGKNELASGHETKEGFTAFGRRVVKRMEEHHMIVDVSHLNDRGFEELCEFAEYPFIATHSNLRSVCSHKRNLTEAQFTEIVKRQGLVGLTLYKGFLAENGHGTAEKLFEHVYRMLELGGEDTIACGSDFDGADIGVELDSPYKLAASADYFSRQGLSDSVIRKIFYENALEFFRRQENTRKIVG